jgi:hypothetical protein
MTRERYERTPTPTLERKHWDERLHEMLRWRRPHGSQTEKEWVDRFIVKPYDAWPIECPKTEDVFAWVITVPPADGTISKVMFSCHVDTVHQREGRQKITYNMATNCYGKNDGEPLGADNAAGVWLLLEMIDRKVPGTYFFHRGEEKGGIGSDGIAGYYEKVLHQFDMAIAFDRKATWSVITHQWGGRCCSDAFAVALAEGLNNVNEDFMYCNDDSGLFTDTANYTHVIPECTNVSVGYYDEHTGRERLDLEHLFALRDALPQIAWHALPVKRDPSVVERDDWELDVRFTSKTSALTHGSKYAMDEGDLRSYDLGSMTRQEMEHLCYDDPELFIDLVRYEVQGDIPKWVREEADNYNDDENIYRRA